MSISITTNKEHEVHADKLSIDQMVKLADYLDEKGIDYDLVGRPSDGVTLDAWGIFDDDIDEVIAYLKENFDYEGGIHEHTSS